MELKHNMEFQHYEAGKQRACLNCEARKHKCEYSHDAWSSGPLFQTSAGYLRVRVVEGDPISTTLFSGETSYLTAVAAIQSAQYSNRELDKDSEKLIAGHTRSEIPEIFSQINCLDPWLFPANERSEIQEERQRFYRKVWKLLNHVNHQISFNQSRDLMELRLVLPEYSTLEVNVCVRTFEEPRKEESYLIGKDDIEDSYYTLSRSSIRDHSDSAFTDDHRTSSRTFMNENNKRVRPDEDSLAGSCQPSSRKAKGSHLTLTYSSTSPPQPYGDAKSSISSTIPEHIRNPHGSGLSLLNTTVEAERPSEEGKGTEEDKEDEEVKEDEEDKEKRRGEETSRNDDKSGQSNESLVNDHLLKGDDIRMGTSLGTSDQAVYTKQEYPTCGSQMFQPQLASTVVGPWNGSPWDYTEAAAYQRNDQQAEMITPMPIADIQKSSTTLLDENTKAKQLRDFGTDSTNVTYNYSATDNLLGYCSGNTVGSAAYDPTIHNGWEHMSNATSTIPLQYSYHHHAHIAPRGPTHYWTR